jgi:histidyl-tRNA synthetase
MSKLSLQPYKGTRDFYPEEMAMQQYLFSVMRQVVALFGYEEYNASILEETALYHAKSGEEMVGEQTYSFEDRGGRDVTIRPEMTPTLARMVAQRKRDLAFPVRWFSIPNLFRYERPQRGRLREHWQLNVDVFGIENANAEIEVLELAYELMRAYGATDEMFTIHLNSRKLINFIFDAYLPSKGVELDASEVHAISKLIDRRAKISPQAFVDELEKIAGGHAAQVNQLFSVENLEDFPEEIRESEAFIEIDGVMKALQANGITNCLFDINIMRGFDYYTGIVFEVFDTSPENNRSLFGGGRYDKLLEIFDMEAVPAFGFGAGDVTLADFVKTHGLMPEYISNVDLYICVMEGVDMQEVRGIAKHLREHGVHVAIDYSGKKVAKQIKKAVKDQILFVTCIGSEELASGMFKLKNLMEEEEVVVSLQDIAHTIQEYGHSLGHGDEH